ncbi:MAG TPA: mannonate dehydratase [Streptosporangiaceae bacterium]|jgi:mannonate dehydratase|nr:mannonate dehydratase [Streptosporangiaceae bacterium]
MRIAVGQAARATHEYLAFARQIGAGGVQFNTPDLPGERRWEASDLIALRERVESYGLRLEAIENLPNSFYTSAMFGLPGRDEEIENVIATVRNLGRAGIAILGFHWMPTSVWRTAVAPEGRGGAVVSAFDLELARSPEQAGDVYVARRDRRVEDQKDSWTRGALFDILAERDEAAMWASFEYFLRSVAPAAEESGVCLAVHPDDPPVGELGGVARIFRSVDALKRAAAFWPGPGFAIELCLGTISEMGGQQAVLDAVGHLGPRGKIAYVHLRDVSGTVPSFTECFLGEGNYHPPTVLRALRAVGFDGFILDDHTPALVGDSPYGHRGRAFALGYIQGLIEMMELDDRQPEAAR